MFSNRPSGGGGNFGVKGSGVKYPQLDGQSINTFIDQFSSSIKYWKAIQCPCTNHLTEQPNVNCPQCRGLGWFHSDHETDQRFLRAQVHSRSSRKSNGRAGDLTTGGASITFLPGVIPGDGDLVQVLADREVVNDEAHVVGAKLLDGSTAETLRFRDVVSVEIIAVRGTGNAISILPAGEWAFNPATRKIDFSPALPQGTQYSVRYIAIPEYIVRGDSAKPLLRVTHDDGLMEPQRSREDIVYPFNVSAVRLDRAIIQRLRGALDLTTKSTFNNESGRGPFR